MFDEGTIKNFEAIEKLIDKHFELTDESRVVFSTLLNNPDFAVEFEKIAAQPDKRLWFNEGSPALETSDTVWMKFKDIFKSFIKDEKVSYRNFIDGRVEGEKKILTAFIEHSYKSIEGMLELVKYIKSSSNELFRDYVDAYYPKSQTKILENIHRCEAKITLDGKLGIKIGSTTFKKKFNVDETKNLLSTLKTKISAVMNKDFFGTKRPSGSKICFSLNYADWFLASTGENWFSCVNFTCDIGNWRGLPGLVGDKNRLLVYVSDGTTKEFHGVKTPKMLKRCWCFLFQDKEGNKILKTNRLYPGGDLNIGSYGVLPESIKVVDAYPITEKGTHRSVYDFPTIFHKQYKSDYYSITKNMVKFSSSITEDTHTKKLVDGNINYCFYDTSSGYGVYCYAINKDGKNLGKIPNKNGPLK